ncbi:hypothetical protein HJ01_03379 [Flavobacterium frigoris PS1]|uniref:Uncharacterized protein n=1 Tax=Flavobacterium frigoris (strain PS1) TaxID=1086011 RepID=H7FW32_FLAFP|nr:hypothetical protein HJ01_03379 [Flavobacterium frigoris PS1]
MIGYSSSYYLFPPSFLSTKASKEKKQKNAATLFRIFNFDLS